jgi:hypothetical protein
MIEKNIIWTINSFLLFCVMGLIGVIYASIINKLNVLDKKIEERTLIINCDRRHEELDVQCERRHKEVDNFAHHHAKSGQAGEVVPK